METKTSQDIELDPQKIIEIQNNMDFPLGEACSTLDENCEACQ